MADSSLPSDLPEPKRENKRITDESVINNYMNNIKEYIAQQNINLKDLIYHNIIWNKVCFDSKKITSNKYKFQDLF